MARKFSLILMLIIALAPFAAQGLGLGDIQLQAFFNQLADIDHLVFLVVLETGFVLL